MKTYFTADLHLGHERIVEMSRPWLSSIEQHDDLILDAINSIVQLNDRLYILGDFCWRGEESYAAKIRCKNKHLIFGNHDKAKAGLYFKTAEDVAEIKLGEHKVFLSHYPHAFWPSSHYGSLHLYGHLHDEREETLDQAFPGRRSMDVGVNTAYRLLGCMRPFSQDEILDLLLARPGHDPVEWYRERETRRNQGDVHVT